MSKPEPSSSERPLSPHLFIYKPQISSVLSISHRISGLLLVFGAVVLVSWLVAAAYSPDAFYSIQLCLQTTVGTVVMVLWSFAFYYHLCNGIRHLFWDAGYGFELPCMRRSGMFVLLMAGVLTFFSWGWAARVAAEGAL